MFFSVIKDLLEPMAYQKEENINKYLTILE